MSGRPTREQVAGWADEVEAVGGRIGRHFARSEPRRRAAGSVRGLPGDAERENGWHLAESLGDPTPDGVQHLARYVADRLGGPDGVRVADETGFLEKGTKSCGVARQWYSGTAGRIENCQVGVSPGYVSPKGRALIDRALYLPSKASGRP